MKPMLMKLNGLIVILAMIFAAPTVLAGDAAAGQAKATVCLTCHGQGDTVVGVGTPIIAGQYKDYLIHALKSYRSGTRNNAVMAGFSANLSDQDIEDLAAFYSEMESQLFTQK